MFGVHPEQLIGVTVRVIPRTNSPGLKAQSRISSTVHILLSSRFLRFFWESIAFHKCPRYCPSNPNASFSQKSKRWGNLTEIPIRLSLISLQ